MIDTVVTRFGFARMPFGRGPAAVDPACTGTPTARGLAARITWAVADKTIAMITGEVGTGKTVAIRCAVADLDPASHTVIYVGNPATGVRGILAHVVTALGGKPVHGILPRIAVQAWANLRMRPPNAGAPRSWSSTRLTCSAMTSWSRSG